MAQASRCKNRGRPKATRGRRRAHGLLSTCGLSFFPAGAAAVAEWATRGPSGGRGLGLGLGLSMPRVVCMMRGRLKMGVHGLVRLWSVLISTKKPERSHVRIPGLTFVEATEVEEFDGEGGAHRTRRRPPWRMCHAWHARRTLRRPPGACATRGKHTARSAPLPGARATCGIHAARSAARLAHVPRVVFTPHAPHVPHVACTSRPDLSSACCPLLPPTHILARQPPADECVLSQAGSAASDSTHSDEPSASSAW